MDGTFIQFLGFLALVLVSILGNEKKRKAQIAAQRAMRPPTARREEADEGDEGAQLEAARREPQSREEMIRILRERVLGPLDPSPVPTPVPVPVEAPPPPPREEVAPERPVVVDDDSARARPRARTSEPAAVPSSRTSSPSSRKARSRSPLGSLRTPDGLRRAIVAREVLGPPRALDPFES